MKKFSKLINENKLSSKFKLGVDFHGVITSLPSELSFLTNAIVAAGGEVHILTGGSWTKELEADINKLNINWTHKFSIYDYLIETNAKTIGDIQFPDGTIQKKFNNDDWDHVKANYCREHSISIHIDDTLIYNDFFTTPFARLWTHTNTPKSPHKDVRHLD